MGKGIGAFGIAALVALVIVSGTASVGESRNIFEYLQDQARDEFVKILPPWADDILEGQMPDGMPGSGNGSGPSTAKGAPAPPTAKEARQLLSDLRVAPAGSMATYDREAFDHWSNAQEFGWSVPDASCDVRDAALIRDAVEVSVEEGCDVEIGKWVDPYTGSTYTDPADMDIDHVVALGNAWRSGADKWTDADREAFANDPEVLLTAEDNANQEKSDKGPEEWVPSNENYKCEYARRWTNIKHDWRLSIVPAEKSALTSMLDTCPAA